MVCMPDHWDVACLGFKRARMRMSDVWCASAPRMWGCSDICERFVCVLAYLTFKRTGIVQGGFNEHTAWFAGTSSGDAAAAGPSAADIPSSSTSVAWEGIDEGAPSASIQLRLSDGSRMVRPPLCLCVTAYGVPSLKHAPGIYSNYPTAHVIFHGCKIHHSVVLTPWTLIVPSNPLGRLLVVWDARFITVPHSK